MPEMITETELITRIKAERERQRIPKAEVARWLNVTRQMIDSLEDPEYRGRKALQSRMEIYSRLLDGAEVTGPYVMIKEPEPAAA